VRAAGFKERLPIRHIHASGRLRFLYTMNKNLIALTFLGLIAILFVGCTATTGTTTTTTTTDDTRMQSSRYAH